MLVGFSSFVVHVHDRVAIPLRPVVVSNDLAADLLRDVDDVVRFLAHSRKHALATIDPVTDVVPAVAASVPEAVNVADVDAHPEMELDRKQLFRAEDLDKSGELSREFHCIKGIGEHEDVAISNAQFCLVVAWGNLPRSRPVCPPRR